MFHRTQSGIEKVVRLRQRVIYGQWSLCLRSCLTHLESRVWAGPGSPCEPEQVALESNVEVGPGSPCEPELVVVDMETWLESRAGDGLRSV